MREQSTKRKTGSGKRLFMAILLSILLSIAICIVINR